jgi:UDP-N-acetylmuramoyl-L-alanyl-D-glutamate--2,6-diaminopimelate ligase
MEGKMKLKEFLPFKESVIIGNGNIEVTGVSYDSRKIEKNFVFFALPGNNTDGRKYIYEAVERGACAIVSVSEFCDCPVTQIIVKDIMSFMSFFGAVFYNYPDKELTIIGITGTNGKTTITYMIESIFANSGIDCGVIGTVNYRYKDKIIEASNTTPQSLDIYKIMREISDAGVKLLAMEVSSHALALGRVKGIEFDIAVWTNLTQDHLDFHKTLDNYFSAKSILFQNLKYNKKKNQKYAVINADDEYGKKLAKTFIPPQLKLYSTADKNADCRAANIEISSSGSKFNLLFNERKAEISLKHIGLHNVYNALAAFCATVCSGISFEKAAEGLDNAKQAPGRLEKVGVKNLGFEVVVDYAHTNDALKNVLSALKELNPKRIITVFGGGGDRDRSKRPLMGKTAVEMSDFVFVTSDNPRTEEPEKIILDIETGIRRVNKNNYKVIPDREMAIKSAIMLADKGDIVLIAGKGHETYQIVGNTKIHFNDIEIAQKYIDLKEKEKLLLKEKGQKEFNF